MDKDGPSITRLKSAHGKQRQWSFYKMDPSKDQLPRADLLLSRDIGEVNVHAYMNVNPWHMRQVRTLSRSCEACIK